MSANDSRGGSANSSSNEGRKRPAPPSDLEHEFNRSGERQRLNEIMYRRLSESGWMSKVRVMCEEYVANKEPGRVTVEEIINEVRNPARRMVPDDVKVELMGHIRKFVSDNTT